MEGKDFAIWLEECFSGKKAEALIKGEDRLPSTLTKDQRAFMEQVLNEARIELDIEPK